MAGSSELMETVAAAMLDGVTLSLVPVDVDGTQMPTEFVVSARREIDGRTYGNATRIGFADLVLSESADHVLASAVWDAVTPVVEAAVSDRDQTRAAAAADADAEDRDRADEGLAVA